uniref:Molybdate transport system ATP-binding protein n=1 Tax=Candidatus Kentrum sp. FM TaxID=2126340 RepID=A0A450SVA3_9GAMM|nr:MAG: molybdate transport system ATP-binding protein [Candidatus Kentron sp. FM]VFJ57888.1 MAG: molybdate transport system ATP-binding protein [Candidatus Kentron sp. FM]VFK11814.1 MAG: molybdate transport system ATP-binding protein [Candidatus Kentron sp. FM]
MNPGITFRFRLGRGNFRLDAQREIPGTGVTALFGRSGSGKTTLLRCIAGLERVQDGFVSVNGECWQDTHTGRFVPPHKRALGFVFQDGRLFGHLTVAANLFYGHRRTPKDRRRAEPGEITDILGLGPLLGRYPGTLSGGEKQRVALGRALMNSPRLLLMDEPMTGLDGARKEEVMPYLEALRFRFHIPFVYVSHDMGEITRVADWLVLMEDGRTHQAGPLAGMLARTDLPIAREEDAGAVLSVVVARHDEGFHLTEVHFAGGRLLIPRTRRGIGERLRLRVHARDVSLTLDPPGRTSILNVITARVMEVAAQGPGRVLVRLDAGGVPLLARITEKSCHELGLREGLPGGLRVHAQIKSVALGE